jgi:hypothetical protein
VDFSELEKTSWWHSRGQWRLRKQFNGNELATLPTEIGQIGHPNLAANRISILAPTLKQLVLAWYEFCSELVRVAGPKHHLDDE